ncbi:MAG TPA: 1-(5-phosphoribosyl)-5-[(5-phosphoribosylamino)methylideneamino] imidazole-4-carboxamide isomerase [Candidatus Altiarchaeales archaeon]|nr:1-(5-phosphoribosyl)-5-[(5-phosphoribosylamino)methylideneamino] imidazole-4-carboxamide isomerase [Candidatus Altiarchaeales archaeon]
MKIIPAIDLMGGECVQLVGGDPSTKKSYGDPLAKAKDWVSKGASMLHVVDLDATLGFGDNTEKVREIVDSCGVKVQFGGGVRSFSKIGKALDLGVERVIIGTLALDDYLSGLSLAERISREYPGKVIASVDSRKGFITSKGWTEDSDVRAADFVAEASDYYFGFLYTDVSVEGLMGGINLERIQDVVRATDRPVIVSGGITTPKDVQNLKDMGVWGVVLGKSIYEGRLDIASLI